MKRLIAITTVAAALLLGGTANADWYIMIPPQAPNADQDMVQTLSDAPLGRWRTMDAFPSAKECNDHRSRLEDIMVNRNYDKEVAQLRREGYDEAQTRNFVEEERKVWADSQCIPSGDARLLQR
jgi:hypothetical protein